MLIAAILSSHGEGGAMGPKGRWGVEIRLRRAPGACSKGGVVNRPGGLVVRASKRIGQMHLADSGLKPKARGTCKTSLRLVTLEHNLDSKAA